MHRRPNPNLGDIGKADNIPVYLPGDYLADMYRHLAIIFQLIRQSCKSLNFRGAVHVETVVGISKSLEPAHVSVSGQKEGGFVMDGVDETKAHQQFRFSLSTCPSG